MTQISAAKNLKALAKGARHVLVLAPSSAITGKKRAKLFGKRTDDVLEAMAKEAPRGGMGAVFSTLHSKDPGRLSVGVLPNKVSRHGCPARGESIRRCVEKASLGSRGRAGVVLVLDDASHVTAAINAVGRALPQYSGRSGKPSSLKVQVFCVDSTGAPIEIEERSLAIVSAARDSAELVDTPPTELNPKEYARRVKEMLKPVAGVTIKEVVGNKLLDEGLRGIHSVGRTAVEAPRMLVATYTPESGSGKHIALVGKGITYDTGGLNIKVGGNMASMKCDMGGSAAVLGAFRVLAAHGCSHTVSLVMCMAENAIGPASYKPDDILEMHSGKTVEINNTDAEGRLLLADGVSYAARVLECDVVIDAATLTGAQLVTTGKLHGAVFSNDEELEQLVVSSGYASGDPAHAMLFVPELLQEEFRSRVADMTNSVGNRMNAQSSCAAQFVYSHIADTRVKWCQIDLAGPAFPFGRGTGYGVALLANAVQRI